MTNRLKNKVSLITGSTRGIGKAIALGFAEEGSDIIINYVKNENLAIELKKEIENLGRKVISIKADVSNRSEVKFMFKKAYDYFGKVDILINNAGINNRGYFMDLTDSDWDQVMNINLKGPFICSQEFFYFFNNKKEGGRIINISSVASQYHGPKTVHYAVSKAGLNSLTKILSRYGAEQNILVNAVAPGLIITDQTRNEFETGQADKLINWTLLKRAGEEKDVLATCLLLAEQSQNYITGQVIAVSGGAYLG
tara:strand:+ start:98 stop:856 length:759 start_codon:yes stop_codon:yes gene_type:complete